MLFGLHAIRGNVVAGKKSCLPSYFSVRMGGCGAALLLAAAAGAIVFDIRSNTQTTTSAPAVAVDTITIEEAMKRARPGDTATISPGNYSISHLAVPAERGPLRTAGCYHHGDIVVLGPKTVICGFTFAAGTVDISNTKSVTIGDCAFNGGTTAIMLDGASDALVITISMA
jgi:hypothetical protein